MADPQKALNDARQAKGFLSSESMPVKGSVTGMLIGGGAAFFLKRNVITYALIGALIGGAINVLISKNKSDEQE